MLGGSGAGAGGALPVPFASRGGFVSPVGVGRVLLEECVAGGAMLGRWGGKGPERLTGDKRQCHEGMLGEGQGWGAVGRDPGWKPERTGCGLR